MAGDLLCRDKQRLIASMQDDPFEWVELALPRALLKHLFRMGVACFPALFIPEALKSMSLVWFSRSSIGASSRTTCMRVGHP